VAEKPLQQMKQIIDYIEHNIKEKLTLEDIAGCINLSKYHLHRIFKSMTGKTLMDYVRNRKLSCSLHELLNTDLKIIDIASEYNFDYEQSYIRSFRNVFSTSPHRYRQNRGTVEITDRLDLNMIYPIAQQGFILNPAILLKPAFLLAGIRHYVVHEDNRKYHVLNKLGNEFFYTHRSKIRNKINPNVYYGYVEYSDNMQLSSHYTTAVEVSGLEAIHQEMTGHCVPARKYAVFKYIGLHHPRNTTIASLSGIYEYAFRDWLQHAGYWMSDPFHFERIDVDVAREDYCEVELYIPVRTRE
jgi:AraC family transcriptional regulator